MGVIAIWNKDPEMNKTVFDYSPLPSKKRCGPPITKPAGAVIKTESKYKRRKMAQAD